MGQVIPPAPNNTRVIGDHITTTHLKVHKLVKAEYSRSAAHSHPNEAHQVAILTAPRFGQREWYSEINLQAFGPNEAEALRQLEDILRQLNIPVPDAAQIVLGTWMPGGEELSWDQQPMGARGNKPRKARTLWTKPDGTTMHIYKATGKPHADPNCPCQYCSPPPPPPEEDPAP